MPRDFRSCFLCCLAHAIAAVSVAVSVNDAFGGQWPNWRGPLNRGVSDETGVPVAWSREKNVAWRVELPGSAGATPVVWDDRIFVTSVDGDDLKLLCFNASGKKQWERVVGTGNKNARSDEGNSASPSPVTDGKHVWSFMGNGSLACYDVEGKKIWGFEVPDRYGEFKIAFGMTSTPVVDDKHLYLQLIHGDGNASTREAVVAAVDKLTGEEVWTHKRNSDAVAENEHSYASPMLYKDDEASFLISHGADFTIAHDLGDGSEIWRVGGLNPHNDAERRYDRTLRFVASPVAVPGLIVIPTAKRGPVVAVDPKGAKGDLTDSDHIKWEYPKTPDVPSPLVYDGLVYLCMEDGNLHVLDANSGEEQYKERTHRNRHRASPVYADGKIYLTARDGKITVVKAGRKFEIVSQNDLQEPMSSSPAVSNGTIYLRTFKALWAIRE